MSLTSTKPRVLLVDDDTDILLALSDYLGQEGFQVETVETGAAALQKSTTSPYDVVVLDVDFQTGTVLKFWTKSLKRTLICPSSC